MIGLKFYLNEKCYVLIKEEKLNLCNGCAFQNVVGPGSNLCNIVDPNPKDFNRNKMCQSFDAIFKELFPDSIKGVKKKLLL